MSDSKRYQVFVSSTYLDLQEERQAVTSALLQLDAFPAGMELFPVADDDAWTLIERVIEDCDYYLLVIGGKYGSTDSDEEISYTEREYDFAVLKKKPVMAFLHADPDSIPAGKVDKDARAQAKLEAFRRKVMRSKHVKFWTSPSDLAGKVALSFAQFTKQYPAVGWVRADLQANTETLLELNALRKRVLELEYQLDSAQSSPPPGTESLAQGSDEISVTAKLKGTFRRANPYGIKKVSGWFKLDPTWDGLFGAVSGVLLDECEQSQMQERLEEWLFTEFWDTLDPEATYDRLLSEADLNPDDYVNTEASIEMGKEEFETILVQFMALGLIVRGTKRRSVSDTGIYWKLTPYGEKRTIQLRARVRQNGD
ncbi:DUF4062 domain-containing protein [Actinoallomurus sp. NPDC052308]|uniref:DUF4062 domain-containing protein n=1 Tax=Actinoallomurus sp. NPDC052308 TaxID=3155530 RepID=UPI00343699AE